MAEYKVPAVHAALGKILKELSVEKGGTLPSNMGGKPYITASDLNSEVKRKFVENDLIYIPNEKIIKHEINTSNNRLTVAIVVEGTYEIVSTNDGSSITLSGVGDGLAQGSAVASNIASTNALKNALLRLFLVTEQSVEDGAKGGFEGSDSAPKQTPAARKIEQARGGSAVDQLKDAIRKEFIEAEGSVFTTSDLNDLVKKIKAEDGFSNASQEKLLTEVQKRLRAGEVA